MSKVRYLIIKERGREEVSVSDEFFLDTRDDAKALEFMKASEYYEQDEFLAVEVEDKTRSLSSDKI